MKIKKNMVSVIVVGTLAIGTYAVEASAKENPWMLRLRAVKVSPDVDSTINGADGGVSINSDTIPELDITYFFTKNLAAELVLATSRHTVKALKTAELGTVDLLPPTLTLQYHFNSDDAFKPYLGAGLNYTIFYNEKASNSTYYNTEYSNEFGYAFQAGFDYMLDDRVGINFDVKKLYLNTDVTVNYGAVEADVDVDPWLVGVGVVYKF